MVPLDTMKLLQQLLAMNNQGEYLFPSLRTWARPMSEKTLNAALRRIGNGCKCMNIETVTQEKRLNATEFLKQYCNAIARIFMRIPIGLDASVADSQNG